MTRLTSAQQRATRRAVEQAWRNRYVNRRRAKQALNELDSAVRHPAARPALGIESHHALSDWFNTPAADHVWVSPECRPVELVESATDQPARVLHTQGYDDVVREALRGLAADAEEGERISAEEQRRSDRRYRITQLCIWTPVLAVWVIVLLLQIAGAQ